MKLSTKLPVDKFSADQLVLQVSETVDPKWFDLGDYEDFIEEITRGRGFQQEAIENTIRFLCGGEYKTTEDLARKSYEASLDLQRRYPSAARLIDRLPFPDRLACTLDMATGTGKSFVYHAVARIMLNEGHVDRVLVLCPSVTIEESLKEKFRALVANGDLGDLLPERTGVRVPDIVDAMSTVKAGQICIENIHATYERTSSSIDDSFAGQGERTLVISDETHHVYSTTGRQWKEFLGSKDYRFRYLVGGSGTCYQGDDYFSDVIYRYPIRQAIDDGFVKEVFYLDKDDSSTDEERFQKLLSQHEKNRKTHKHAGIKPLTIAVTQSIKAANALAEDLTDFLTEQLKGSRRQAEDRVLVVTSSDEHRSNLVKLRSVDAADNPAEWIVSVAMLSEGWDVANVLQIYPHEKRAFNSKLLVSQVLGRGLRRPPNLEEQPIVYVFNHERWGPEIEELVAEVLDVETTISQRPTNDRKAPNFDLHYLEFDEVPTGMKAKKVLKPVDIEKISLRPQRDHDERTTFVSATGSGRVDLTTRIVHKRYPVSDVVADVRRRMREADKRLGSKLAVAYPKKRVEKLIVEALKRLRLDGSEVTQENRQLILSAFGSLQQKTKRPGAELKREPAGVAITNTEKMRPAKGRISGLTSNLGLFYDDLSTALGTEDDAAALKKAEEITVPTWREKVANVYLFKSPVNVVLTSHLPEKDFVSHLLDKDNAEVIRSWVKAPDSSFYTIEFSYKKTKESKRRAGEFNPDFFIWLEDKDEIVVVETKADSDDSPVNVGKLEAATEHFEIVNRYLQDQGLERHYQFHFLSPSDYDGFFDALRADEAAGFVSGLQGALV
jgi:type III restriction enzyme